MMATASAVVLGVVRGIPGPRRLLRVRVLPGTPRRYWVRCSRCGATRTTEEIRHALRVRLSGLLMAMGWPELLALQVPLLVPKTYLLRGWIRLGEQMTGPWIKHLLRVGTCCD